ncbi:Late embryogenesis abundant protein [Sesbania bispinosa]|nr:Late embryogenesis abundant protein [Sesbania bispinosa]
MAHPPPQSQAPKRSNLFLRYIAMIILALIILVDANHLYANFDFTIRAYNPNSKVSLYYDHVEVSVRYEDQTLATNAVQPFFQSHKNVTRLHARLTAQTVALYDSVPKDLKLEKSSGDIGLDVLIRAKIRFKVGVWKSKHRIMRFFVLLCWSISLKPRILKGSPAK